MRVLNVKLTFNSVKAKSTHVFSFVPSITVDGMMHGDDFCVTPSLIYRFCPEQLVIKT